MSISDIIEGSELSEIGDELFKEENCANKSEYVNNIRTDGYYLGGIILEILTKELKIIFGIYLEDERYSADPWKIITPNDEDYKGIVLLNLYQGSSCQTGHYSGIKLFNKHFLGNLNVNSFIKRKPNNEIIMKDKNELNTVIINTRSINDYLKKIFIIDLLRSRKIDVAFVQETFLLKTDKIYFPGYKIFRDENEIARRKGVMIIINKNLDVNIQRLGADPNGRFVKIRIKNNQDENSLTLSSAYLEPNGEIRDINQIVFDSDVIGGDLNNADSGLNKYGVFHYKGISILDELKFDDNRIFDHPIIFGKIKFGTYLKKEEDTIKILNKQIIKYNESILKQIVMGNNQTGELMNLIKTIQVRNYEQKIDVIKFGEEYAQLKEDLKVYNMETWKERYQNLNMILTQNNLIDENWYKINKILLTKQSDKILNNKDINDSIIKDFMALYGHQKNRQFKINETLNVIYVILQILKEYSHIINGDKLFTPKSKSYDYNGFSQRIIINYIKDNNYLNQINKFINILTNLSNSNSIEQVIHKNIRTILIKKKEEADSIKDLRPISILPAWVIVLEKLAKPIIDKLLEPIINKFQFGFKAGSDCGIAKAMIIYKSKKYNYNKSLLIDIKKAYDSVNRDILKRIINDTFKESGNILLYFINIYDSLTTVINGIEINNINGLPQGSAISPTLFNIYINNALEKINEINNLSAQAYADDLILQSNNIDTLQKGYDITKYLYSNLKLQINSNKCELISDQEGDYIIDKEQNVKIESKIVAKYLGQLINEKGIPTTGLNKVSFGRLINIIKKTGELTRIAKIRLFHIYLKSKINHLIPLISLTGRIKELWKTIRSIVFTNLLEYSTTPRETASSFRLGYYDIIIRPVLKLIKRNKEFTQNIEEDSMLKEAAKELFKYWLIAEPNQTEKVKETIIKNIKDIDDNHESLDKIIDTECFSRLYKNHVLDLDEIKKLRCIKSPGLLVLISNEPIHEFRQRLIKFYRAEEDNINEYNKMLKIIIKLYNIQEYISKNAGEPLQNEILINEDTDSQLEKMIIKEIQIREKWKKITTEVTVSAEIKLKEIIEKYKKKEEKDIEITEIDQMITHLRHNISCQEKELIKELELGIELENLYQIKDEYIKENEKIKEKRPVGRPKKQPKKDKTQNTLNDFLNIKNKV